MIEKIKVCQHNAARSREILHSTFEVAMKEEVNLLFVQEPYTYKNNNTNTYTPITHPSFIPIAPYTNLEVRPRVITYINKTFPYEVSARSDLVCDPDFQMLEISIPHETFYILHIYNEKPTTTSEKRTTIQRFLDNFVSYDKPFLFLGDFNLHHPDWNPIATNPSQDANHLANLIDQNRGRALMNAKIIEDQGGTFHRLNTKTISIIDLAFSFKFKRLRWKNWRYVENTGSDHKCIVFEANLPATNTQAQSILPKYNLHKADWDTFQNYLLKKEQDTLPYVDHLIANYDYEALAKLLQDSITQAAAESIPLSKPSNQSKSWWTQELTDMRKSYHSLHRKSFKVNTPEAFERARVARNLYFHSIRKNKNAHWQQFLNVANEKTIFTAYGYSNPKKYQTSLIPTLRYMQSPESGEILATTFTEKCQAFISTLFPSPHSGLNTNTTKDNYNKFWTETTTNFPPHSQWEWPELGIEEIIKAVPDKDTAPGSDQISWPIVRKALSAIPSLFFKVYHTLFHQGYHPKIWREAVGIIIPKYNKKDYATPKSYRPISLLPCLSKILEKVFANRLAHHAHTSDDLLHYTQMGARKQRSATDAALLMQTFIEQNLAQQKTVSTLLLDIMGAFDRLRPSTLIKVLKILNLPYSFISWAEGFLTNRSIRLLFNSKLSSSFFISGTPQGSPISPILFLISIRFLFGKETKNISYLSYMDDISVSVASYSVRKNITELEKQTNILFYKAKCLDITFEREKTELIHFYHGRTPPTASVTLQNTIIEPQQFVRWLGIWFDSKLSFAIHMQKRLQLANGAIQRLKGLTSPTKGLRFNQIRQLYMACVIPILDYGSILYYNKFGTGKMINKYQSLQNMAVRLITGAFHHSPTKALEVEAAIPPTRVRQFRVALSYALRLLRLQYTHPVQQKLFSPLQDELLLPTAARDFGLLAYLNDNSLQLHKLAKLLPDLTKGSKIERLNASWLPPWQTNKLEISISKVNKEKAKLEHENKIKELPLNSTIIYTDGSLVPGKGCTIGIVIYLPHTREVKLHSYNIGDYVGISDAETFCIYKAIKLLISANTPGDYNIFSDSQTALSRIKAGNDYFSHQIRNIAKYNKIRLKWCPGHVGIEGNEMADQLARNAFSKTPTRSNKYLSHSHLKQIAKQKVICAWQNNWEKEILREEEGRQARGLGKFYRIQARRRIAQIKLKPFPMMKFTRKTQSAFIQARTGIGNTRAYLYKIGKVKSAECNFCHSGKQTMGHLILQCPKYRKERYKILGENSLRKLTYLFNTTSGKNKLLQYLELTGCVSASKGE